MPPKSRISAAKKICDPVVVPTIGVVDDNVEDDSYDCPCGVKKSSGYSVQCSGCRKWQHNKCVGLKEEKVNGRHKCPNCKKYPRKWPCEYTKELFEEFEEKSEGIIVPMNLDMLIDEFLQKKQVVYNNKDNIKRNLKSHVQIFFDDQNADISLKVKYAFLTQFDVSESCLKQIQGIGTLITRQKNKKHRVAAFTPHGSTDRLYDIERVPDLRAVVNIILNNGVVVPQSVDISGDELAAQPDADIGDDSSSAVPQVVDVPSPSGWPFLNQPGTSSQDGVASSSGSSQMTVKKMNNLNSLVDKLSKNRNEEALPADQAKKEELSLSPSPSSTAPALSIPSTSVAQSVPLARPLNNEELMKAITGPAFQQVIAALVKQHVSSASTEQPAEQQLTEHNVVETGRKRANDGQDSTQAEGEGTSKLVVVKKEGENRKEDEEPAAPKKARVEKTALPPIPVFEYLKDFTKCFGNEDHRRTLWEKSPWLERIEDLIQKDEEKLKAKTILYDEIHWQLHIAFHAVVNASGAPDDEDIIDTTGALIVKEFMRNLAGFHFKYHDYLGKEEHKSLRDEIQNKAVALIGTEIIPVNKIEIIFGYVYAMHGII